MKVILERIPADLSDWEGSATIRVVAKNYERKQASQYKDAPAALTPRQEAFHRNLESLAKTKGSPVIPVDFIDKRGEHVYLDRGCIKIAEHAGFIQKIQDDETGVVGSVILSQKHNL